MTYSTLKIQGKKIEVGDDDANHDNHEPAVVCNDFWNEAPEDVLTEIFIRHPDCRSAVRTSTVCCRWHSLIHRNRQFIQRFKSHHHQHLFPWIMMLREIDSYKYPVPRTVHTRALCQLYSDEWMFLHGKLPADCLDFLPSPMLIRAASCSDLLLVSPGLSLTDDLYICSPITKQFIQLPANPRPLEDTRIYEVLRKRYALVAMPPSGATTDSRFKVVELLRYFEYPVSTDLDLEPNLVVQVSLFCSESRKWEIRNFPCLGPSDMWCKSISSDIITCNGILYWLGTPYNSERLVYFDLLEEKCGVIDMPSEDKSFAQIGIVHAGGGVHELRLIQVLPMDKPEIIHLRVWRLNTNNNGNDEDSNWFLVHNKKLKRPKNWSKQRPFRGTFVHPTNGDFLFIVWGKIVIEYNLTDATDKKMAELIEIGYWSHVMPFVMVLSSTASNLANSYL